MELGCAGARPEIDARVDRLTSIEAVLEQLEAELVGAQFDAFEFLDRDADAKTLHEASFAPHTPSASTGLRCHSMRAGQERHEQSAQDSQQLACIEIMTIRSLEQNGGRDVQQYAHQNAVQCTEDHGFLRQGACDAHSNQGNDCKNGDPDPPPA